MTQTSCLRWTLDTKNSVVQMLPDTCLFSETSHRSSYTSLFLLDGICQIPDACFNKGFMNRWTHNIFILRFPSKLEETPSWHMAPTNSSDAWYIIFNLTLFLISNFSMIFALIWSLVILQIFRSRHKSIWFDLLLEIWFFSCQIILVAISSCLHIFYESFCFAEKL